MGQDLYHRILDYPNPASLIEKVTKALAQEGIERAKFRARLRPDVKAEFILGEVILHGPTQRRHNQATKNIFFVLEAFISKHHLGELAIEKAMVALARNDLMPDVAYWRKEVADHFDDDLMYYPAPDLVVEVLSKNTESRDRGTKLQSYEAAGVLEYWIVDPRRQVLEQYLLFPNKANRPTLQLHNALEVNETVTSRVIQGFFIQIKAFFDLTTRQSALATLLN